MLALWDTFPETARFSQLLERLPARADGSQGRLARPRPFYAHGFLTSLLAAEQASSVLAPNRCFMGTLKMSPIYLFYVWHSPVQS